MAQFSRIEVALQMKKSGIVPLFYHSDPAICIEVIQACYNGGMRIFEFTNRGDFAHDVFSEVRKYTTTNLPDLIFGVGSVIDHGTCSLYMQMGADFIVSPLLNEEMAKVCNRRKVLWMPGCGSASEISKAEELGAEIIKIFPGGPVGGPAFIKAIKGPCPWTSLMPSGGVAPTQENLKSWFDAGATCVGMGSKLITKDIVKNKQFDILENKVKETLELIKNIRKA